MTLAPKNVAAIQRAQQGMADEVPHITLDDIKALATAAQDAAQHGKGERDALIIQTLADGCLRVSECLRLTPTDLHQAPFGWAAWVLGKGGKRRQVAISAGLAAALQSYAYRQEIAPTDCLFPIDKHRVFRIVERAFDLVGIPSPL